MKKLCKVFNSLGKSNQIILNKLDALNKVTDCMQNNLDELNTISDEIKSNLEEILFNISKTKEFCIENELLMAYKELCMIERGAPNLKMNVLFCQDEAKKVQNNVNRIKNIVNHVLEYYVLNNELYV